MGQYIDEEVEPEKAQQLGMIGAMSRQVLEKKAKLSRKIKMKVYNAWIVPTLLYNLPRTLQARHMSQLHTVEMKHSTSGRGNIGGLCM